LRQPLIIENATDKDGTSTWDLKHHYNPNKHLNNIGNYQKKDTAKKDLKQVDAKTNNTVNTNSSKSSQLVQIAPEAPTGLEPPPPDH
jgi:hypothetical protein